MKINLNELSKIKYIYHVYEDPQRVIHCQKYPVIYINQHVVYYKAPGDTELSTRSLNIVYELCDDNWINRCGSDKIFSFFWEVCDLWPRPGPIFSWIGSSLNKPPPRNMHMPPRLRSSSRRPRPRDPSVVFWRMDSSVCSFFSCRPPTPPIQG